MYWRVDREGLSNQLYYYTSYGDIELGVWHYESEYRNCWYFDCKSFHIKNMVLAVNSLSEAKLKALEIVRYKLDTCLKEYETTLRCVNRDLALEVE